MLKRSPKKLARFVYVSSRQVGSLNAQLRKRPGWNLKAILGVELSVDGATATGDAGAVAKVCKRLRSTGQLGAVGDGRPYSEGIRPMVWGRLEADPEIVFFSHRGRVIIGLAGSAASLHAPGEADTHAHSDMGTISQAMVDGHEPLTDDETSAPLARAVGLAVDEALRTAAMPPQQLQFVAGLQRVGSWDGLDVYFGSPLFVTYAENGPA